MMLQKYESQMMSSWILLLIDIDWNFWIDYQVQGSISIVQSKSLPNLGKQSRLW